MYILHKDANPFIEYGPVVSVSAPKPKYPMASHMGQLPQNLPAGMDIADFGQNGNIVVSCSRDAMNNEVRVDPGFRYSLNISLFRKDKYWIRTITDRVTGEILYETKTRQCFPDNRTI